MARRPKPEPVELPDALYASQVAIAKQHGTRKPKRKRWQPTAWCWLCKHTMYNCQCDLAQMLLWYNQ